MQQTQIAKDINKLNKLLVKVENRPTVSTALIKKVKNLYHKLFHYFSTGKIKKIALGSAAALLLQTNATAQTFGSVNNATSYGLDASKIRFVQPILIDMDNDGDQDIIYCDNVSSDLRYVPNTTPTGGGPVPITFGSTQLNPFGFIKSDQPRGRSAFADIDNDGDFDLLYCSRDPQNTYISNFIYYANTGSATTPIFSTSVKNPFSLTTPANNVIDDVNFVDIDNDGDFDIIAYAVNQIYYTSTNLYYENTGTNISPTFAASIANTFGIPSTISVSNFIDLDNDNDFDILTGANYIENTGSATTPTFGTVQTTPFNMDATPGGNTGSLFTFGDIDNDGKPDLMNKASSSVYIQFNTTPTSVDKVKKQDLDINIYPTPSHDLVNINLGKQDDYTLEVFNLQGQQLQVQNIQQATQHQLDLSDLASGQYLLKISTDEYYTTKQLIKQ